MMISDSMFPRPDHTQYPRYLLNVQFLSNSGTGVSFYDGISALDIRGTFHAQWPRDASDYLKNVGLIVCEHIWPWGRIPPPEFHWSVVKHLLDEMPHVPKIVLLRTTDVDTIRPRLVAISRLVLVDDVHSHYQPLRMRWNSDKIDPIFGRQTAICIRPIQGPADHMVERPLHIPREVLLQMFKGKQTLFLASGTCDSPVESLHYLLVQFGLHGVSLR